MENVACLLCESCDSRVVVRQRDLTCDGSSREQEFTVVRCERCGLLYLNPRPEKAELARYYCSPGVSANPSQTQTRVRRIAKRMPTKVRRWLMEDFYGYPATTPLNLWRRLRKLVLWPEKVRRAFCGRNILPWAGQGRLLDVGCGQGPNMATLHNMGWDVYGVDLSETAVREVHELFGDHVKLGDFLDVHYDDRSFDVVLFNHSLEHLYDPVSALREARRILDDKGVLVVTVPNAGSMEARLFGRWWYQWDLPRHLNHFEKATLAQLLRKAGFRVERCRTGVGELFFLVSLDRVWRHVCGGHNLPLRIVIEKLIAQPFSLLMGHLGLGTEITVFAVKA